jgi:tRNA (guanine26-N2/guanine27-N2)-dimethyltransferase
MNRKIEFEELSGRILSSEWPDFPFKTVEEGSTEFQIIDSENIYDAPAFYNPAMILNRDISLLVVKLLSLERGKKLRIFEPLAGISIRAMRMVNEIPEYIEEIVSNDFNEISTAIAGYNINQMNLSNKITLFRREARALTHALAELKFRYHYVDLDPFGPPTPFIDSIWPILPSNAIASITATDMTALCGVYPDACLRKYGALPLNNHHTHETAARILIGAVVQSAARHERASIPIVTASVDHFVKILFSIKKGRGPANTAMSKLGYSYTCESCQEIYYKEGMINHVITCCGTIHTAGPLWTGDLFDPQWCQTALDTLDTDERDNTSSLPTSRRIRKILEEGVHASGLSGYFVMSEVCKKLKITQPKFTLLAENLQQQGYRCIQSNFTKQAFRTDASGKLVQQIISALVSSE